jgi:hypothetical protein
MGRMALPANPSIREKSIEDDVSLDVSLENIEMNEPQETLKVP